MESILTSEQKEKLALEKTQGKVIGYATGVWDLFHRGHLNLLKEAKKRCDFLVVGVSTDQNCFSYKNRYPVVPFEERKDIVSNLKFVDMVVPQLSMDKLKAWDELHFDLLFHGNDIKYEFEEELNNRGAKVVYLEYTPGISTTLRRQARHEDAGNPPENIQER